MYRTTFIIKNKIKNKPQLKTKKNARHKNISKRKKKQENDRKNFTTRTSRKSEHRESSRLRNYKTFIPQSKILKKVELKSNFDFKNQ